MTTRRSFLRLASGLLVAGAVPLDTPWRRRFFPGWSAPGLPTLYGDGVTDDSPALQALLDGFPVWDLREGRQRRRGEILKFGNYQVGSTIVGRGIGWSLRGPDLHVADGGSPQLIERCTFRGNGRDPIFCVTADEPEDLVRISGSSFVTSGWSDPLRA